MQPELASEPFHREGWVYEEKYDGWRCSRTGTARVRLVSGSGVDHTTRFPEIAAAVAGLLVSQLIRLCGRCCSLHPEGAAQGSGRDKPLFEAIFAEFGKPGAAFSMTQQSVEGDYAYILWKAETADNVYEVGTDTFVVRNGKIVAQSFAGKITPKG